MDILCRINWVDIVIVIIMIRITYVTFSEGFSHGIFPLFSNALVAVFSIHYYGRLASLAQEGIPGLPQSIAVFFSFLLLVVASGLLLKLIKVVLDKIIKVEWHPLIEKFGGILIGLLRASIVTSLVLILLALLPFPYLQRSMRDKSLMGMYFLKIAPEIYAKASPYLPMVKVGGDVIDKQDVISDITADKDIAAQKQPK